MPLFDQVIRISSSLIQFTGYYSPTTLLISVQLKWICNIAYIIHESLFRHISGISLIKFTTWKFPSTFFSTALNASPYNVTGHTLSSTSIFVSWGQVPFLHRNGTVILSYTVTYTALPSGSSQTKNVTAPANQTTLTGLNEYTNYSITVFASTSKGRGNQSTPTVVITDEDSKLLIRVVLSVLCVFLLLSLFVKSFANWMWCLVVLQVSNNPNYFYCRYFWSCDMSW